MSEAKQGKPAAGGDRASGTAAAKGEGGRGDRLAAELRANLARRKAQARSRRQGQADERPDGLNAGGTEAEG